MCLAEHELVAAALEDELAVVRVHVHEEVTSLVHVLAVELGALPQHELVADHGHVPAAAHVPEFAVEI